MKTTYITIFSFCVLMLSQAQAQLVEYLNQNNVNVGIGVGSNLFTMFPDSNIVTNQDTSVKWRLYENPKGTGISPVFTAALWMTALDDNGSIVCSAERYRQYEVVFRDGPVADDYTAAYDNYYHRVFKVKKQTILNHIDAGPPYIPTAIDSSIRFWPGKGNAFVQNSYGEDISRNLAPFADLNSNGIYEPNQGEYPAICGDEAIFFVFNDRRKVNAERIGVEVRGMAEVFENLGSSNQSYGKRALNNTVFVSYEIQNMSGRDYNKFRLGMFEDIDLGCYTNDRVGCDSILSLAFGYNNKSPDPDMQGLKGYGNTSAAQGFKFLNQQMRTFSYFTNGASFNQSDPGNCQQFNNYLSGLWADGVYFTYGGTGHNSGGGAASYIFIGNPNNPNDWSELQPSVAAQLQAGDRRMAGGSDSMNFADGETKYFDFAFFSSLDSTATNLSIVDTLKRDAGIIQSFYNSQIQPCKNQIALSVNKVSEDVALQLFPNPAKNVVSVRSQSVIANISISDLQGRVHLSLSPKSGEAQINVSSLAKGMYVMRADFGSNTTVKKLIIE